MIFGKHQDNTIEQFKEYSQTATKSALLADAHYGIIAPVGSVWAHPSQIQLNGIGPGRHGRSRRTRSLPY